MPKYPTVKEMKQQRNASKNQFTQTNEFVWCKMNQLGKGAFGTVYLGWREPDEEYIAVKAIPQTTIDMEEKVKLFLKREIEIMNTLKGAPFIVQLMYLERNANGVNMFMEMCDTDLEKHLVTNKVTQLQLIRFMQQIAISINAMHAKGIVHRDLKPANILIKYRDTNMQEFDIRLADFGYSRFFKTEGPEGMEINNMLDSAAGTPVYMAPEALACVVEQNAHYNQLVDIWSAGAIIYRVVVGEHGFYHRMQMTMQELLNVIRKKGTAIGVVVNPKGKPIYIKELPEQTEDILNPQMKQTVSSMIREMLQVEPQLRMTTSKFLQTVDDIAVSKFNVISVHTGQQTKVPINQEMTLEELVHTLAKDFKEMPVAEMHLIYESHTSENIVATNDQLKKLLEFLMRSSHKPDVFLVSGALLKELDLPYDEDINVTANLSALLQIKSKRELKAQNNTVLLPQVCKSTMEEYQSLQKQQLIGYQAFITHSINAVSRFQVIISRTEKAQSAMDAQVNTVFRCIEDAVDSLQAHGYENEVNSLHGIDEELRGIMNYIQQCKGKVITAFETQMRQVKDIKRRMGELSSDDVIISAQKKCREITKESLDSQLDKSEDLLMLLNTKQKYFNDLLHLKLTGLNNTLTKLEEQQGELVKVETEIIPEHARKVEKLGRRVNKTALATIAGGAGSRVEKFENPEVTNLKENLQETQREKDEFSDKVEKLKKQSAKDKGLVDKLYFRLMKYNRWFEDITKELELDDTDNKQDKIVDESFLELDSSIPNEIRNCVRKAILTDTIKVREKIIQNRDDYLTSEDDKISVNNLKAGDHVLLLPSKATSNVRAHVHVPRIFTLETNQLYFLDVESYENFKLEMKKDFTSCVTGILTEDPKQKAALAREDYPVTQFGMIFYTVKAKPKIQSAL
ncbi:Inhibitor of nuclear factor kappa-B kinase subunit beta-like [Oopsacas minuta]|uniref:Inhibitor of nuclear factor kappa-B kinase subunit beta-like n=1 Tax=Oopsacas minuta TaxID=111878 RepID=A0AAV7KE40_9METZ|nr:Inhibitor of nuclear factor kappa-B kinase subunit beta-like [Oopsacas minuta]